MQWQVTRILANADLLRERSGQGSHPKCCAQDRRTFRHLGRRTLDTPDWKFFCDQPRLEQSVPSKSDELYRRRPRYLRDHAAVHCPRCHAAAASAAIAISASSRIQFWTTVKSVLNSTSSPSSGVRAVLRQAWTRYGAVMCSSMSAVSVCHSNWRSPRVPGTMWGGRASAAQTPFRSCKAKLATEKLTAWPRYPSHPTGNLPSSSRRPFTASVQGR